MDTPVLDVAIGLSLMFLFVSLFVTIVQESITSYLGLRAANLYDALENLLDHPPGERPAPTEAVAKNAGPETLVDALYRHPQLQGLYRSNEAWVAGKLKKSYLPSYIPSRVFAIALLDVLRGNDQFSNAIGINNLLAGADEIVARLPPSRVKQMLGMLVADADTFRGDANDKAQIVSARIEEWFNDSMARASGWYKRKAQFISFVIGLGAAVFLNADALRVGTTLWHDSNLRAQVTAGAASFAATNAEGLGLADVTQALGSSRLPVGWGGGFPTLPAEWALCVLGWIVTGFGASLGAPFWFDVLNKALRVRGSGVPISARSGEPVQKAAEPAVSAPPPRMSA